MLLRTCLLLLGLLPAHAVDRPSLLRAGSGMRLDDIQMQHLTQKAVCSRNFLGQTPLFKGEWVPHQVSCPCTPFCSPHSPEPPAMTFKIFPELQLYKCLLLSITPLSVECACHSLGGHPVTTAMDNSCSLQTGFSGAGSQLQRAVQSGQRLPQLGEWVQLPGGWHRQ